MLKAIGVRSIDDLFSPIPAALRLTRDLAVPRQMAESEIVDWFKHRAKENGDGYTSFLGAGAYASLPTLRTRPNLRRARSKPSLNFRP